LEGKPEGKRPRGKHRCRWEYNIKMDNKYIDWEGMDWISLPQDMDSLWTPVKTVKKIWVP